MAVVSETASPQELVAGVERALEQIEAIPDPTARQLVTDLVSGLLALYGTGLERIVEVLAGHDADGALAAELTEDELVAHLLLLHGLHPADVEERVAEALAEVRPYIESHGGALELAGIEDAVVHVRMSGSCHGCPSSAVTLKLAIEDAVHKHAPEIEAVVAEQAPPESGLLRIGLAPGMAGREPEGEWTMVGGLPQLLPGRPLVRQVAGEPLVFLRLGEHVYGYLDGCPACASSLDGAKLHGVALVCPGCGNRYDVVRAGRGHDEPQLRLEPVPLLVGSDGLVKVAVRTAV